MKTFLNFFYITFIFIFFLMIYNFYSSHNNLKIKEFNRTNINQIIQDKTSNLPILTNDTNNVIEFNNSISDKINNDKPRSFWELLKSK